MLERMGEFFEARLNSYEEHQLNCIDSAQEFYPFTAGCLPQTADPNVLDLGCGTGLELGYYFEMVPTAKITGIDLSPGMLAVLRNKFADKSLTLIAGSYLYERVLDALKPGGYFVLTDYFAASDEEESFRRAELLRLKKEQGIQDDEFYHYDTPLTVGHEKEALMSAGFSSVHVLKNWGATYTLKAERAMEEDRTKRRKELRKFARLYLKVLGIDIDESIFPDETVPIYIVDDDGKILEKVGEIEPDE